MNALPHDENGICAEGQDRTVHDLSRGGVPAGVTAGQIVERP